MDEAVKMAPSVQKVFVMDRTGAVELTSSKDVSLESVISFTYLLFITFTYFLTHNMLIIKPTIYNEQFIISDQL